MNSGEWNQPEPQKNLLPYLTAWQGHLYPQWMKGSYKVSGWDPGILCAYEDCLSHLSQPFQHCAWCRWRKNEWLGQEVLMLETQLLPVLCTSVHLSAPSAAYASCILLEWAASSITQLFRAAHLSGPAVPPQYTRVGSCSSGPSLGLAKSWDYKELQLFPRFVSSLWRDT